MTKDREGGGISKLSLLHKIKKNYQENAKHGCHLRIAKLKVKTDFEEKIDPALNINFINHRPKAAIENLRIYSIIWILNIFNPFAS